MSVRSAPAAFVSFRLVSQYLPHRPPTYRIQILQKGKISARLCLVQLDLAFHSLFFLFLPVGGFIFRGICCFSCWKEGGREGGALGIGTYDMWVFLLTLHHTYGTVIFCCGGGGGVELSRLASDSRIKIYLPYRRYSPTELFPSPPHLSPFFLTCKSEENRERKKKRGEFCKCTVVWVCVG